MGGIHRHRAWQVRLFCVPSRRLQHPDGAALSSLLRLALHLSSRGVYPKTRLPQLHLRGEYAGRALCAHHARHRQRHGAELLLPAPDGSPYPHRADTALYGELRILPSGLPMAAGRHAHASGDNDSRAAAQPVAGEQLFLYQRSCEGHPHRAACRMGREQLAGWVGEDAYLLPMAALLAAVWAILYAPFAASDFIRKKEEAKAK